MQKILLGFVAIAAVAGWVVAFLNMTESSDLGDQLVAAKAELSDASERLTDTQSRLTLARGGASSLQEIDTQVAERHRAGHQ